MSQKDVEAIYPLSPLQAGMLFHSLLDPASGVYVEQYCCTLDGALDAATLQGAWQATVAHHGVLRTLFNWKVRENPLQIVRREVELPLELLDWRPLPPATQEVALAAHLEADRRRGFDLAQAPLMRVALIQLQAARHVLVWTFHHAILDGWSVPLLLDEVFERYAAQQRGVPLTLQAPRPFKEYIAWLARQDMGAAEAYWRAQLAGLDANRSIDVREGGALARQPETRRVEHHLPATLTAALQAMARQQRLTMSTVIQGAWALLLSHYTGEGDVLFGVTVAGRPPGLPGVENMVGLFINTLPVRVTVTPAQPLGDWLAKLQAVQTEARCYEYVSLVQLQQWSTLPKGVPLFDTLVLFENQPSSERRALELAGLQCVEERVFEQTNFPLTLVSGPGERLPLILQYDGSRYSADTVERIAMHLATLLEGFVATPHAPLTRVPMLTQAEQDQIVGAWNATARHFGPPQTIHARFLEQVQRTPQQPALLSGDTTVTYAELARHANGVASALTAAGAGPGSIVAIYAERSAQTVAGLLGILMTGAAYLPLDHAYPPARLALMCAESAAGFLLVQQDLADRLSAFDGCTLLLDVIEPSPDIPTLVDLPLVDDGAAAYVIFTSGSTGRPKGVVGLHCGAVNRMRWMWERYPFAPDEVGVQKTALSFVDSIGEIFGPLLQGIPSEILPTAVVQDIAAFVDALQRARVTRIVVVPSLLRVLLDAYPHLDRRLPALALWICSGEVLPIGLARRFHRQMPHARLLNFYGSSEVSADVTWFDSADLAAEATSVAIGRPMANTEVYVLDGLGAPAPVGVAGTLHVGGMHLAQGYLHQPELTAARFPVLQIPGRGMLRLYQTGDRARYLPDGNLEYLGRRDDQVKIRGARVELGEVRAILSLHPAVAEAEVVVTGSDGDTMLAAYLVPRSDTTIDQAGVRRFAAEKLPSHMVPAAIVVLPSMPLTPNGKVDRLRLPAPLSPHVEQADDLLAPRTEVEARLAAIWASLLKRAPIGVRTSFFDLGGHSLLAMHLFVLIDKEFGVTLPLASLFQEPTVEHLARLVSRQQSPLQWNALVDVQPMGNRPPLYCVHGITGDVLWFRDLGRCLAPDQPLIGLQAPALDGRQAPFESLEAMARHYLGEIRARQPAGPYYIGGASFGGTVALEMAQQLTAQGEQVALLVQFDHAPLAEEQGSGLGTRIGRAVRLARNAPRWLASAAEMGPSRLVARARRKAQNAWMKAGYRQGSNAGEAVKASDLLDYGDQLPPHRQQLIESHYRAIVAYSPQPYAGDVLLLQAQAQPLLSTANPVARWRRLAGERLHVRTVPGSHEGMFHEPHVQQLAREVQQALADR